MQEGDPLVLSCVMTETLPNYSLPSLMEPGLEAVLHPQTVTTTMD